MELTEHRCHRCGGELIKQNETSWRCPYCGCSYDDTAAIKHTMDMHEMFDEAKRELINNARRNLYDATVAKYISSEEIKAACREIKKYIPDDFRANFYEIAADSNVRRTVKAIRRINEDKYFDEIEGIVSFLIKDLQPDYLLDLNNLIERAYKKRGDLQTFERLATEISIQAEKVQQGVYETTLPRDVFIAYSSKDMDKVSELVEMLEIRDGLKCFVAARNLRHGRGSVENYNKALEEAMDNCKSIVFVSTTNSRSFGCDALKIELPHIKAQDIANAPGQFRNNYTLIPHEYKKPRVEYRVEESKGSNAADQIVREFFDGYEWALSAEAVSERVAKQLFDSAVSATAATVSGIKQDEQKKYCTYCGHENSVDAVSCISCGKTSFVNTAEELIKIKNKRELEERQAREEAQRRAAKAEEERKAAERARRLDGASRSSDAPTVTQTPKKSGHGGLVAFIVAIIAALIVGVILIEGLPSVKIENVPIDTEIPIFDNTDPDHDSSYPVEGTQDNFTYELSEYGVLTLRGSGEISFSLYDHYVEMPDGNVVQLRDFVNSIVIDNGIKSIGAEVFKDMPQLTTVSLPDSVTSISDYAFASCTSLSSINLSKVKHIGSNAFYDCGYLDPVLDLTCAEYIGDYAFYCCYNVSSISVSDKLAYLSGSAFDSTAFQNKLSADSPLYLGEWLYRVHTATEGCFVIPDKVTRIASSAFGDCQNLTDIIIPSSVRSIGEYAFVGTYRLKNLFYSGDKESWDSIEKGEGFDSYMGNWTEGGTYQIGFLDGKYDPDKVEPFTEGLKFALDESGSFVRVTGYTGEETTVIIPSSYLGLPVQVINERAFEASHLTDIAIPSTIKEIGSLAFFNSALTSVSAGDGLELTRVGESIFAVTDFLTRDEQPIYLGAALVHVPNIEYDTFIIADGTKTVAEYAFSNHEYIYSVFIPKSVTSVGNYAFYGTGTEGFYYEGTMEEFGAIRIEENSFSFDTAAEDAISYLNIDYDPSVEESYTNDLKFKFNADGGFMIVTGIRDSYTKKDVVIPSTFLGIPVEEISDDAFSGSPLLSISIPATVKKIGERAFAHTGSLDTVNIAENSALCSIGKDVFYDSYMSYYTNADSALCLGNCLVLAHKDSSGAFEIPSNITYIAQYAFEYAQYTRILIPESVKVIDDYAFSSAEYVDEIIYFGTESQWDDISKGENWDENCGSNTNNGTYSVRCLKNTDGSDESFSNDIPEYSTEPDETTETETPPDDGTETETLPDDGTDTETPPEVTPETYTWGLVFKHNSSDNTYSISDYNGSEKNVVIPASYLGSPVVAIDENAFLYSSITSIYIPASVKTIGKQAFYDSRDLVTVTIADGSLLNNVGENAFYSTAVSDLYLKEEGGSSFVLGSCLISVDIRTNALYEIPSNVKYISSYAFKDSELSSVVIPAGVEIINAYAFYESHYIKEFVYLGTEEQWGNVQKFEKWDAIWGDGADGSTVEYSIRFIGGIYDPENAEPYTAGLRFTYNFDLGGYNISGYSGTDMNVVIPSSYMAAPVVSIDAYVFRDMQIETVTIPNSVKSIGYRAFENTALSYVYFPSSIETIGSEAFLNCVNLKEIVLADDINIGEYDHSLHDAFDGAQIEKMTLPARLIQRVPKDYLAEVTVTSGDLAANAFQDCRYLRKINLHDEIDEIGEAAFGNCNSLLSIELPASISSIHKYAFSGCTALVEIINHTVHDLSSYAPESVVKIHNGESIIEYVDDFAFATINGEYYLLSYVGNETDIVLPQSYKDASYIIRANAFRRNQKIISVNTGGASKIEDAAFYCCYALKTVTFGDALLSIGKEAFYWCTDLESLTLPDSIQSIGESSFKLCTSLKSVTFGSSLEKIPDYAFAETNLTKITIPQTVKEIGSEAFSSCSNLTNVIFEGGGSFDLYYPSDAEPYSSFTASTNGYENAEELTSNSSYAIWKRQLA